MFSVQKSNTEAFDGDDALAGGMGDVLRSGTGYDSAIVNIAEEFLAPNPAHVPGMTGTCADRAEDNKLILEVPSELKDDITLHRTFFSYERDLYDVYTEISLGDYVIVKIDGCDSNTWKLTVDRFVVNFS